MKRWKVLGAGLLAIVVGSAVATAQTTTQAPSFQQLLDQLLPGMGAVNIEKSQDAQLQWEQACRRLCVPGKESQRIEASRLMAGKLGPDTASGARIWLLRQLEYLGGAECVDAVAAAMDGVGIGALTVIRSPIRGAKGNTEFLVHLRRGPSRSLSARLAEVTAP